ncbi:hypothetical protein AB9K26_02955 [Psychroserpens sp. XS_ASV72]|uniref:hypothetical protein n=1 Tax=Psychroserpens sp. XS_ASV72 TaxID=3241293 RepID=UPI00351290E0
MRKLISLFCLGLLFTTCDDGDIFEVTLDFGDTFSQCGNNSLVFYKINESTNETLSIQIPSLTLEDILDVDDTNTYEESFSLGGTNKFNYRSYGRTPMANFFCNDIPPANLQIDKDETSISGQVTIFTELVEDDEDGIQREDEDINQNGDLEDDDTDNDGIPNYLDVDDDGDNVLTINELDTDNLDGDDNPLTNPMDSDGDTIPDYLDTDDDGDGVLTRDEENINADNNPTNDFTEINSLVADYLNPNVTITVPATAFRNHVIQQDYVVKALLTNILLPSITQQNLDFGTLAPSSNNQSLLSTTRPGNAVFN